LRGALAPALAVTILGLGAATAMFSLVDALLLRPLPYADAERLVRIHRTVGGDTADRQHSFGAYFDFRAQDDVFEGMAGIAMDNVSLTVEPGQAPDMMWGAAVTSDYFDVFRVQPLPLHRWHHAGPANPGAPRRPW
jgi:putative ABC transport system permease protein